MAASTMCAWIYSIWYKFYSNNSTVCCKSIHITKINLIYPHMILVSVEKNIQLYAYDLKCISMLDWTLYVWRYSPHEAFLLGENISMHMKSDGVCTTLKDSYSPMHCHTGFVHRDLTCTWALKHHLDKKLHFPYML